MKKFNPSKIQCRECKDILQSSYSGEWVCCSCMKQEPRVEGKGCFIDSTYWYERVGGYFTVISHGSSEDGDS